MTVQATDLPGLPEQHMVSIRWYTTQLEGLTPASRRQFTQQLMRFVRSGGLPSPRDWQTAVQRAIRKSTH